MNISSARAVEDEGEMEHNASERGPDPFAVRCEIQTPTTLRGNGCNE